MVKSRRRASAAKSRPNATLARRPSVSTSSRSVVVSIGRPSTIERHRAMRDAGRRDLEPRRSRAADHSSGVAVVARSKSTAGSPSARSRTAPPTSRVSSPPPLSAASARASGPSSQERQILEPSVLRDPEGRSFEPSRDEHAVLDMRRDIDAVAARREGVEGDEAEHRRREADQRHDRHAPARPVLDLERIAGAQARDRARRPRTGSGTAPAARGRSCPSGKQLLVQVAQDARRSRPRYTALHAAWRRIFAAVPAIRARRGDDWPRPSGRRTASRTPRRPRAG